MAKFHRNASTVILLALLASGCRAPLSNSFTARSLGKGKIGLDAGVLNVGDALGPVVKVAIGLSSDLDLGIQIESLGIGVFGKYSFVNNKERGFSLAGVLGVGAAVAGSYAYGGPVLSYKAKSFEPYIVGRFNYVHYGESEVTFKDAHWWDAGTYTYLQFTLGSIFWLTPSIGLNIEGSAFAGKLGLADSEDFAALPFVVLGGVKVRF